MAVGRLRGGELLAGGAAAALLGLLPLRWFALQGEAQRGVEALGPAAVAPVLAALAALVTVALTARERSPTLPVMLDGLTVVLGWAAFLAVAVRLVDEPGFGVGAAGDDVRTMVPAVLALFAAQLVALGGWRALRDERTDGPHAREQAERLLRAAGPPRRAPAARPSNGVPDGGTPSRDGGAGARRNIPRG
jgi:hypothetical protein